MKIDLREVDQDEKNEELNRVIALLDNVRFQINLIIEEIKRMVK